MLNFSISELRTLASNIPDAQQREKVMELLTVSFGDSGSTVLDGTEFDALLQRIDNEGVAAYLRSEVSDSEETDSTVESSTRVEDDVPSAPSSDVNRKDLEMFDNYLKESRSNQAISKLDLLGKIRGMISSGTISFEGGLTSEILETLFNQSEEVLKKIINQEIDIKQLQPQSKTSKHSATIEKIIKGDFSKISEILYDNNVTDRLQAAKTLLSEYKKQTGESLYQGIKNQYNNDKNQKSFKTNMYNLLSLCVYEKNKYDRKQTSGVDKQADELLENLYCTLYDREEMTHEVSVEELMSFDFDKYESEILSYRLDWLIKREDVSNEDISNSAIKSYLPTIKTENISENKIRQTFNGMEYEIEYSGNVIKVFDKQENKTYTLDMDKLIERESFIQEDDSPETKATLLKHEKEDREFVQNLIKGLPAPVLKDLSIETKKIRIDYDSSRKGGYSESAHFDPKDQSITINVYNSDCIKPDTLAHEVAHGLSQIKYKSMEANYSNVADDKKLRKIFNEELDVLEATANDYEVQYAVDSQEEMFAECYALLTTGTCSSNYMIATYFPRSLAYVQSKIQELQKVPIEKRYFETYEFVPPKYR